ncbi:hypothetical protein [Thiorhodovibrio winogradskyi]|nr:hypothetical protein [Thiorhodovibrio winogradskyi]
MLAIILVALTSLVAALVSFRRAQRLRDILPSRIGAAKQGYTQLEGQARPLPESPQLYTSRSQTPCVWYRYKIRCGKQTLEYTESETPFVLDDGTGQCIIDPSDADVRTTHKESWHIDGRYFTEWTILVGDQLDALGEFRTFGGPATTADIHDAVSRILADWKHDMPNVLRHFDRDGDGQLNEQEWTRVREAAERKARKQLDALTDQPAVNRLIKPRDGRPFLISNQSRQALVRVYWFWGAVQLCILIAAIVGLFESGWLFEWEERIRPYLAE